MKKCILICFSLAFLFFTMESCRSSRATSGISSNHQIVSHVKLKKKIPAVSINVENVTADELLDFAETLIGVKYQYGSCDKEKGFDCSGFIWYVFNHFNIKVPRTSEQFTNAGKEVSMNDARRGDLILFTGSDPNSGVVGHMGLITENKNNHITFIHSASGGGRGVSKAQMSGYFTARFVRVNRIFFKN